MTRTQTRRIARFEKLLATLKRTESLLGEMDIADGGQTEERTQQNIQTVESLLSRMKS